MIIPTVEEIDTVLSLCYDQRDEGGSKYPGMTYEEGVASAINWLLGDCEFNPMKDE